MSEPLDDSVRLSRIEEIARDLGATAVLEDAHALAERVAEGRFYVACLGQFKRGKSTLLNALVGANVLPVGVVPVTAVVTVLRHGSALGARVRVEGEPWRDIEPTTLDEYVSEAKNPENARRVRGVEVFVPSALLSRGLCLVDTPGVGSVFAGNTEATRDFVPSIDAALILIGVDPPIAGSEMDLIAEVANGVSTIVFVLGKADRSTEAELTEGKSFAVAVLTKRLGRVPEPLLVVSATERARMGQGTRDWMTLEGRLRALAEGGRAGLVRTAAQRGVLRLATMLRSELDELTRALLRPREESVKRVAQLRVAVTDAENLLRDMSYLFTAVEEQLATRFEKERSAFVAAEQPIAFLELGARIREDAERDVRDLPLAAMEHARTIGLAHVQQWREEHAPIAERLYQDASRRFIDLANQFLAQVAASGDAGFSSLPDTFEPELRFRAKPSFYFHDHLTLAGPHLVGRVVGLFQGKDGRVAAIEREARTYLERLFETNSNRAANDFIEQIRESRRQLQGDLRRHIQRVVDAADRTLERATATVAAGAEAVDREVSRLEMLRAELDTMTTPDAQPSTPESRARQ
jgi:hypothetical protein